jgi:prepilin signal peptidase PulO-like enzyme (type II secretory pathway)
LTASEARRQPLFPLETEHPVRLAVACVIGAALFVLTLALYPEPKALVVALALVLLVGCIWYDIESFLVPNALTYPGILLVLSAALLFHDAEFAGALLGMVAGGMAFVVLNVISKGAVGIGDAKLVAFGGALVGVQYLLIALLIGSVGMLLPSLVLLAVRGIGRRQALPYAPALASGFIIVALINGTTLGL